LPIAVDDAEREMQRLLEDRRELEKQLEVFSSQRTEILALR
jgi:hypothetical protein